RIDVFTAALPGETSADLAERWDVDVQRRYSAQGQADGTIDHRVVVAMGRGDVDAGISLARSRLNLAKILDGLERLRIPAFVVGPPPTLDLPYIMPAQAQKHVTHNEALDLIDTLLQCAVADRDLSEPPEEAQEGERYIVAADAGGTWAGREGTIALRRDGGWRFLTPRSGWRAWVVDEAVLVFWNGDAWEK